jgi:hypothetical protein
VFQLEALRETFAAIDGGVENVIQLDGAVKQS